MQCSDRGQACVFCSCARQRSINPHIALVSLSRTLSCLPPPHTPHPLPPVLPPVPFPSRFTPADGHGGGAMINTGDASHGTADLHFGVPIGLAPGL